MVPPASVDASVKFAVRPVVVNVKFGTGVPPPLDTVTVDVFELDLPLALSATVSVTLYEPAAAYVWLGLVAIDVAPSPNVHECDVIVPPESVDASVKFAVRPDVVNVKF